MNEIPSKERFVRVLKELATPINFQNLTAKGILKKSGAWYVVQKPKELPSHAWRQAIALEFGPKGKLRIKLKKSTRQAEALYKRVTGRSISG